MPHIDHAVLKCLYPLPGVLSSTIALTAWLICHCGCAKNCQDAVTPSRESKVIAMVSISACLSLGLARQASMPAGHPPPELTACAGGHCSTHALRLLWQKTHTHTALSRLETDYSRRIWGSGTIWAGCLHLRAMLPAIHRTPFDNSDEHKRQCADSRLTAADLPGGQPSSGLVACAGGHCCVPCAAAWLATPLAVP